MPNPKPHAGHYRPDIDGLRAIAILAVLAFHALPAALPGGFVGVDVFFVISGYLITGIILGDLAQAKFDFTGFYVRRIRRIFPALATVLAACLCAGWFVLYAGDYAALGKHVAGGAGFVSNLLLWNESGYFDQEARLKPLLHLWSLGIEEQFYLLWPLLLWLGWRSRLGMPRLIGAIAVASLLACLWMTRHDAVSAFYAPWSRFWELLAGGLLAHRHLRRRAGDSGEAAPPAAAAHAASLLGIALVLVACAAYRESDPFPGWRGLLPVAGSCLLVAAGPAACVNRWLLSRATMRWIGNISYPLYLWHWPLLAYLNLQYPGGAPLPSRLAALAASVALAAITCHAIEKPLRFGGNVRAKAIGLLLAMAAIAAAGLLVMDRRGFPGRFPSTVAQYADYRYDFRSDARIGTCWLNGKFAASGYADECVDPAAPGKPLLLLWGDSHAGRLYPGLRIAARGRVRIAEYVRNACAPYLSTVNPACLRNNRYVLSRVSGLKPRVVVLFAAWNRDPHDDPAPASVARRIGATIRALREAGATRVVVLGPAPQWRPDLPKALVGLYQRKPYDRPPRYTDFGQVATAHALDRYLAAHLGGDPGVAYVSTIDAMCKAGACLTWVGSAGELSSWDYGHLTTPGAIYLANALDLAGHAVRDDW